MIKNSKGNVYYGLHFYPGVAEYREIGKDPYRVYLNENTLRAMDPTFAGRPVYVSHVDEVNGNVDELRAEADGWVIESFFNEADGKHWVKFIAVSQKAEDAITRKRWQLSNAYIPKTFAPGGMCNGVDYTKEITGGEYEHLAIVPNPRYEESTILTPDQFKKYNDDRKIELLRLANEKEGKGFMKFFKKTKVENAADLTEVSVVLPNSGREVSITTLVNEADALEESKGKPKMANMGDMVEVGKEKMNVGDLISKFRNLCDEFEAAQGEKENGEDSSLDMPKGDTPSDLENKEDEEVKDKKDNKEDEVKDEEVKDKKDNKEDDKKEDDEKKKNAKEKADKLRNANSKTPVKVSVIHLSDSRVAKGKARYGS